MKTFTDLVQWIQAATVTTGTTGTTVSALDSARNALRSLQSDSRMANNLSLSFNGGSLAGNSSSSCAPLPSAASTQAPPHRFLPYSRDGGKNQAVCLEDTT